MFRRAGRQLGVSQAPAAGALKPVLFSLLLYLLLLSQIAFLEVIFPQKC